MMFEQLVELALGGFAIGSIYGLMGLGFSMIIRATGILHFAQGEIMMLGSMIGVSVLSIAVIPFLPLLLVGMIFSGLSAVVIYLLVYRRVASLRRSFLEYCHCDYRNFNSSPKSRNAGMGSRSDRVSKTFSRRSSIMSGQRIFAPTDLDRSAWISIDATAAGRAQIHSHGDCPASHRPGSRNGSINGHQPDPFNGPYVRHRWHDGGHRGNSARLDVFSAIQHGLSHGDQGLRRGHTRWPRQHRRCNARRNSWLDRGCSGAMDFEWVS